MLACASMTLIFLFLAFGIISLGSRAYAAGGVYQCIPCPTGIDCPAGTNEADVAEDIAKQSHVDGNPVGTIIALALDRGAEFDGYLLCDGQDIPAGTKYDALREFLAAPDENNVPTHPYGEGKVPDFQGYFLRGAGGNAAAAGTAQADSAPDITGSFDAQGYAGNKNDTGAFSVTSRGHIDEGKSSGTNYARDRDFMASRSSASYGRRNEVAPMNYAVYYYIKY
jgi:hypothetical protein